MSKKPRKPKCRTCKGTGLASSGVPSMPMPCPKCKPSPTPPRAVKAWARVSKFKDSTYIHGSAVASRREFLRISRDDGDTAVEVYIIPAAAVEQDVAAFGFHWRTFCAEESESFKPETLGKTEPAKYLANRLHNAFVAGWNAASRSNP